MKNLAAVILAWTALAGAPARAQEGGAAPAVEPPVLLEAPPPAAAAPGSAAAEILLTLTLDAEGRVTAAEPVEPGGDASAAIAREAALALRFAPARRGGTPVGCRVRYRYAFAAPAVATTAAPSAAAAPGEPALEVTVRGLGAAEALRRTAEAVKVVEVEEAARGAADAGEVLARTEGVSIRRTGGLGSAARVSLGGLSGDQIRYFADGVPLELAGFPFGIANVPLPLLERIELYRGVVPVRFGADALGGAINVASPALAAGTHGSASYQLASFGTRRLAGTLGHLHAPTGLFVRASGFHDRAENDYPMDVQAWDGDGRLRAARVRRFHDAYGAGGAFVEAGVADRPWARRLTVRAFAVRHEKELPGNATMEVPYGEVEFGRASVGAAVRLERDLGADASLDLLAGYARVRTTFLDVAACVYDWHGRCERPRPRPGEIEGEPHDQALADHAGYARLVAEWRLTPAQTLRLAVAPTLSARRGDERRQAAGTRDPLEARRRLLTVVTGLEHVLRLGGRFESVAFVKDYLQDSRAEEQSLVDGAFRTRSVTIHRAGAGVGLRWALTDRIAAKGSYEWTTRLPHPDELFGDGVLVDPNLDLRPETSHNVNLGLEAAAPDTRAGALRGEVTGLLREVDQLILLVGTERFTYQNVYAARMLGAELAAGWTAPGGWLALDGNATYLSARNTAGQGTFGQFRGDQLPNRPRLLANGSLRLERQELLRRGDTASFTFTTRHVRHFYRGWESIGREDSKQVVPSQLLHGVAVGYLTPAGRSTLGVTAEVRNLTDAAAYDQYGAPRPGRSFSLQATVGF